MMRRITFALACALALPAAVEAQALPPARVAAHLADSLARAFVAQRGAPSVAIAIVRGRDTIVMAGYGKADLENDVAATERSAYRIGSVTKQFTAAAVMKLVEEGKVKLDETIGTYFPSLPEAWRPVTVRQLLNHTSGIPSYTSLGAAWQRRWGEEMSPDSIAALTASQTMNFAPGADWRYNNTGYVLLGMLIEKVAGRPWGAEIEERFTKPLGLADTRNCMHAPLIPRRVHGYGPQGNGWANAPYLAMSQPYAAGALCSSVADLARWNRALHTGGVVSAASYRLMTTPEGAAAAGSRKYGFGLGVDTLGGRRVISHGGGIHGFITANAWIPDAELSITVLTNSGVARADDLLNQLARAALGIPLVVPAAVVPLPAADRARYVGVYALPLPGGARDFTVAVGGDGITGQLAGQEPLPLLHYGNHTFGASFDPALRLIFTVEGGRATSMTLVQNGGRFVGPRK
jgi:CubicO group peptidase (beta-lactamase class C family)